MRVITDRLGVSELFVDETLPDAAYPLYFHHRAVPPAARLPQRGQYAAALPGDDGARPATGRHEWLRGERRALVGVGEWPGARRRPALSHPFHNPRYL